MDPLHARGGAFGSRCVTYGLLIAIALLNVCNPRWLHAETADEALQSRIAAQGGSFLLANDGKIVGLFFLRWSGECYSIAQDIPSLRELAVQEVDSDFDKITELSALTHLNLRQVELDDNAIAKLAGMPSLVSLKLGEPIATAQLASLLRPSRLKELSLAFADDQQAALLQGAGSIESLGIESLVLSNDEFMTDEGLRALSRMPNLEALALMHPEMSATSIGLLKEAKRLKRLRLFTLSFSDAHMKEVGQLTQLTALYVGFAMISDVGIKEIQHLKNLKCLDLSFATIDDSGLKEIGRSLGSLERLSINLVNFSGKGLSELQNCKRLRTLVLWAAQIPAEELEQLGALAALPNLRSMMFESVNITPQVLRSIESIASLQRLYFDACDLTTADFRELGKFTNLTHLHVSDNPLIEREAVEKLAELPKLNVLSLNDSNLADDAIPLLAKLKRLRLLAGHEMRLTADVVSALNERDDAMVLTTLSGAFEEIYNWQMELSFCGICVPYVLY